MTRQGRGTTTVETTGQAIKSELALLFEAFKREHPDFHIPYYSFFCVENNKNGNNKMFFASNINNEPDNPCLLCFRSVSQDVFKDGDVPAFTQDTLAFKRLDYLDSELGNVYLNKLKPVLLKINDILEKNNVNPKDAMLVCNVISEGILSQISDTEENRFKIRFISHRFAELLMNHKSWRKKE